MGVFIISQSSPNLFEEIYRESKNNQIWRNFKEIHSDIKEINRISSYVDVVKPDVIFHLKVQSLVRESYFNPIQTWETNVIGSLNLLNL